ncbi:hypothetical protein C8A00DRAFT_30584 [Chaetomidium leptoderma]|uniref:Atos-like conserved domain-containing protein n=1 Tax=Chaetomidium leptoderma TaxID=669021 RepID=A0AAN6VRK0_9PEZI|nr:hypothetical protein C8A00DRAFT_30584 [Chaetomidium leptoderma]
MPMLHEDEQPRDSETRYPDSAPIPIQTPPGTRRWLTHRHSEESIRTDLCEGPLPDSPPRPATPHDTVSHAVSDRAELIERLKRGESPTWVPNRHLESLFHQNKGSSPPRTPQSAGPASPGLLPAPTITPDKQDAVQGQQTIDSPLRNGLDIERPRSALHSGNFTPVELSPGTVDADDTIIPDDEGDFGPARAGWMSASPPRDYTPFNFGQGAASYRREAFKSGPSSLSSSLSSSFAYQPPTSPLVQSESNEELDLTLPLNSFNIDANSPRNPRRHTLNLGHSPFANAASHRQSPLRRESTYPYQAHQPRRSLNSTPSISFTGTSPQTPASFFRSRQPSFGSEASPLHHASMVGSYEESILRGRMSTTPSKPLEFTAQIGVLGLGKCKASLRCPAHVTLPFSAVFYNYAGTSSGGSKMEDGPSPYVGQIDLENGLPNPEEGQRAKRKLQSRYQDLKGAGEEGPPAHDSPAEGSEGEGGVSKASKSKRPSRSLKAPPGGGYRIPEKGQLQIIIKNQNKTAVKLFLVPYDLTGMEPGTKTFIRQRSYSTGPIVEADMAATKDTGSDRPTLRYLIHLHICCPSKGRHYLYKSIRVVFANRVPDGKERLRNEATYPDPRFTPYKPIRVMHPPLLGGKDSHAAANSNNNISANAAVERGFRRRSLAFPFSHGSHHHHAHQPPSHAVETHHHHDPTLLAQQTGQRLQTTLPTAYQEVAGSRSNQTEQSTTTMQTTPMPMPMPGLEMTNPTSVHNTYYDKLNKGDVGYGGNANGTGTGTTTTTTLNNSTQNNNSGNGGGGGGGYGAAAATEGLLSQRLRSLGVQQQQQQHQQQ